MHMHAYWHAYAYQYARVTFGVKNLGQTKIFGRKILSNSMGQTEILGREIFSNFQSKKISQCLSNVL